MTRGSGPNKPAPLCKLFLELANKSNDPLAELDDQDKWTKFEIKDENERQLIVSCHRPWEMDEKTRRWMIDLTEKNMSDLYNACEWGWNRSAKEKELNHKTAYILLCRLASPNSENQSSSSMGAPAGFLHFRFEKGYTEKEAVVYCYELQIEEAYRRRGLGQHLMAVLEALAEKFKMNKVTLTCLKGNEAATTFYRDRCGFKVDAMSPDRADPSDIKCYDILSKKISGTVSNQVKAPTSKGSNATKKKSTPKKKTK